MKKWNCMLPVLLAVLLVSLLPITAMAQEFQLCMPVRIELKGQVPQKQETFRIRLRPLSPQAPMPEGSTPEGFLLQQKGPGTVDFPPISFLYPGKHLYSVTQLPGKTRHYTYDPAVYTLEVILQSTPAGLAPTVILSKEGMEEKAGELAFVNRYDPPSSDQPHTGDDFPLTLWVSLNVGSGLALAATAAVQLKKKRT